MGVRARARLRFGYGLGFRDRVREAVPHYGCTNCRKEPLTMAILLTARFQAISGSSTLT